jgi:nucleoid-associated protein YgaU
MKRYDQQKSYSRWDGKQVYKLPKYPKITASPTDIVIISKETDYLDSLAYTYYKDPTLYWVIALANNIGKGKLSVEPGLQLRIPTNVQDIVSAFQRMNRQ